MTQADPAQLKYLLDSVIVIDHLSGDCKATDFMASHGQASAISVITRAEVLAGTGADGEVVCLATAQPVCDFASDHRYCRSCRQAPTNPALGNT